MAIILIVYSNINSI